MHETSLPWSKSGPRDLWLPVVSQTLLQFSARCSRLISICTFSVTANTRAAAEDHTVIAAETGHAHLLSLWALHAGSFQHTASPLDNLAKRDSRHCIMSAICLHLHLDGVIRPRFTESLRILNMHKSCGARRWQHATAVAQLSTCQATHCSDPMQELTICWRHSQLERAPEPEVHFKRRKHGPNSCSLRQ